MAFFFRTNKHTHTDKYMYCRLASNLKTLHYDECEETEAPSVEQLKFKSGFKGGGGRRRHHFFIDNI